MKKTLMFLSCVLALQLEIVRADTMVDISGLVNSDMQTYSNGTNYPLGGTTLTNAGVSFVLANGPGNNPNGTGNILATAPGQTFDLNNLNIANAGVVYVLINSGFGSFGVDIGSIEFKGSGGLDYTVDLVEGTNVRDHLNGLFNNVATDVLHTFAFNGGVRLDEYKIVLPVAFNSASLTDIILNSNANTGGLGEPFLAAATVTGPLSAVPEPSSFALLGLGGIGTAIAAYRRRRIAV